MKKNLTQMVFVLDMSGSMKWLAPETIGGYNTFLSYFLIFVTTFLSNS